MVQNNYFTAMCSGSEAGSYLRLIDFVYHSTQDLRVIQKRRRLRHDKYVDGETGLPSSSYEGFLAPKFGGRHDQI